MSRFLWIFALAGFSHSTRLIYEAWGPAMIFVCKFGIKLAISSVKRKDLFTLLCALVLHCVQLAEFASQALLEYVLFNRHRPPDPVRSAAIETFTLDAERWVWALLLVCTLSVFFSTRRAFLASTAPTTWRKLLEVY